MQASASTQGVGTDSPRLGRSVQARPGPCPSLGLALSGFEQPFQDPSKSRSLVLIGPTSSAARSSAIGLTNVSGRGIVCIGFCFSQPGGQKFARRPSGRFLFTPCISPLSRGVVGPGRSVSPRNRSQNPPLLRKWWVALGKPLPLRKGFWYPHHGQRPKGPRLVGQGKSVVQHDRFRNPPPVETRLN